MLFGRGDRMPDLTDTRSLQKIRGEGAAFVTSENAYNPANSHGTLVLQPKDAYTSLVAII